MFPTPASLLDRLRKPDEATSWDRFVELYTPLLFHWAQRLGLQASDSADLVQDVFLLLWRKLPEFEYDSARSFHAWLKTMFLNRHRDRLRHRGPIAVAINGPDLAEDSLGPIDGQLSEAEYTRYVIRQAFRLIEREFSPVHQKAFRAYVLEERPPEDVARELGISPGTVYSIKSKILSRLRLELCLYNTKLTRDQVGNGFLRSTEDNTRVVVADFGSDRKRTITASAASGFVAQIRSGTTFGRAAAIILGSEEFFVAASQNM